MHENFQTVDIQVNSTGAMEWTNITATSTGNITIEALGTLKLVNCTLTLTGNLVINGIVTLTNTTIKMDCAQNAEYQIEVNGNSGGLYINDYDGDQSTENDISKITSATPGFNNRYSW